MDVDHIVFVSTTGLATPSIEAHLANALPLRTNVCRTPIWGLGCAGAVAGLARARDFALADPGARVLVVALELCSLTFQREDHSKKNLIGASLFADGAAAVLVTGTRVPSRSSPSHATASDPRLHLIAGRSTIWRDSLDVMGWEFDATGMHLVLS